MELLKAPIPGQSLTDTPKNYPWENPPELTDPDEALAMHMSKFNDPEVIDNMLDLLDLGFPGRAMAETILTASVAAGWHSIDVSIIIAPAMHEHIISIANEAGVDYVEGFEEEEEAKQAKERERIRAKVAASLSKTPTAKQDEGYDMAMEALGVLDTPEEEYETLQQEGEAPEEKPMVKEAEPMEETTQEAPQMQRGLMARG